jgi:hypothetical protein
LKYCTDDKVQHALAGQFLDAYEVMKERVVFPIPCTPSQPAAGIKAIGNYLGVCRPEQDDHWIMATEAFSRWIEAIIISGYADQTGLLAPVVEYVQADVQALFCIASSRFLPC